jgi:predicted RNase H-like HicB family nuclease
MGVQLQERTFNVLVEKDEDGYYVGSVVELPGCHTQAKTLDQLRTRIKEAIEGYLLVSSKKKMKDYGPEFIGVLRINT